MKINSFFKILNRKINSYDKITSNPFLYKRKVIVVWVEDSECSNIEKTDSQKFSNG